MIGQKKLKNKIDTFTINNFPHSVLLLGEYGSEKEEICEYISLKLDIPTYDITNLISEEYIHDIYSMLNYGIYIINSNEISEREQNILLKFFEEPNQYIYIILSAESKANLLDTIITRSYEMKLDKYSKEELIPLCKNELIDLELELASTPGMVEELNHLDLKALNTLCENIVNKLSVANYQNTLTITNKINFKDEYDKFPLWAFVKELSNVILRYILINNEINPNLYWLISDFRKNYIFMNDKKRYFENLLTRMWLEVR